MGCVGTGQFAEDCRHEQLLVRTIGGKYISHFKNCIFIFTFSFFFLFLLPTPCCFHGCMLATVHTCGGQKKTTLWVLGSKFRPSDTAARVSTHWAPITPTLEPIFIPVFCLILENSISMLLLGYFCSSFASLFTYLFSETESQEPGLRSSLEFAIVLCGHELLVSPAATSHVLGLEVFASTSS